MDNSFLSAQAMTSRQMAGRQSGFNLVEVLIALLVLAAGLLGMAALQNFSLTATNQSFQRTQATVAIQDIIDKMRANKTGAAGGNYSIPAYTRTPPVAAQNCASSLCAAAQLAAYDMNIWMTNLISDQALGPTAQAQILLLGPIALGSGGVASNYQIGVSWMEGDLRMTQTMTVEAP